jgi:hypothetical protein
MHPYDRYFFDETLGGTGNYTVRKWVDDVNERYGGVDSILMWPTCKNRAAAAAAATVRDRSSRDVRLLRLPLPPLPLCARMQTRISA